MFYILWYSFNVFWEKLIGLLIFKLFNFFLMIGCFFLFEENKFVIVFYFILVYIVSSDWFWMIGVYVELYLFFICW